MCRECVKTQNKFSRKKIDLLQRAVFNFFDKGDGLPTHDFSENLKIFCFYTAAAAKRQSTPKLPTIRPALEREK